MRTVKVEGDLLLLQNVCQASVSYGLHFIDRKTVYSVADKTGSQPQGSYLTFNSFNQSSYFDPLNNF